MSYPKVKYHPIHGEQLIKDAREEEALGEEWCESPAEFGVITAPSIEQMRMQTIKELAAANPAPAKAPEKEAEEEEEEEEEDNGEGEDDEENKPSGINTTGPRRRRRR